MRSGYEYKVRDTLIAAGVDFEYESVVLEYTSTVRMAVCNECGSRKVGKMRKYTPDFIITRSDCSQLIVEAKGRFTSADRSKMRDVRKAHPHLDIRMLFQKRYGKAKLDIEHWCAKNGMEFAFGDEVPESWL